MRHLASIQRVLKVEPIENADNLEVVTVLGWHCVVAKGQFGVNDLVVYIECDSVLPDVAVFKFMEPRHFRVKTIKLRGVTSQGLVLPLSILDGTIDMPYGQVTSWETLGEGYNVTELLGITKYDPPLPAQLTGIAKGNFPSFIPRTDETRVQNLQNTLDKYQGTRCYITEKLDGSSATYYVNNGDFGVCSRNLDLQEGQSKFWEAARAMDIEGKLRSLGRNIAVQGELIGSNVQGNKYDIKGQTVRFFNAWDIDEQRYYGFFKLNELLRKLRLPMVPLLGIEYYLGNNIDDIVEMSIGMSRLNPKAHREGIVIRPVETVYEPRDFGEIGKVSLKAINPKFLLKYEE